MREAIQFYSKSQRFHHAVRLARDHGYDNDVFSMAQLASKQIQLQSANYFEKKNMFEKAAHLYIKGGNKKKATDLAVIHHLSDITEIISKDSNENDDPHILKQNTEMIKNRKQYDIAVHMLIKAKKYDEALETAEQNNVPITDEMNDKLIPERTGDTIQDKNRNLIIIRLAKHCKKQGNFVLACKNYTQGGEKLKGMKCLLKSADLDKIIYYANNARSPEVYVLAANYLQSSDWHNNPEIMKTIINFYVKAKSFEQLSGFYDACAQVEIDEYRDYEKAMGAMKEAMKQMQRSKSPAREEKLEMLRHRIEIIEKFVQARNLLKTDPNQMVTLCNQLLEIVSVCS
jgi:intraflagellar transport protein 140